MIAKQAGLSTADRSGDGDQLVDIDEAARVFGYANRCTIDSYLARRNRGYFPEPGDPHTRQWHRRTLWAFADRRSRPGRGGPGRTPKPRRQALKGSRAWSRRGRVTDRTVPFL